MLDVATAAVAAAILCGVLAVLVYLKSRGGEPPNSGTQRTAAVPTRGEDGRIVGRQVPARPGGRRGGGGRMRRAANGDAAPPDEDDLDEDATSSAPGGVNAALPSGKIGKKKMEKLQAKAEKKREREAVEQEREERKKLKEAEDELSRKEAERENEQEMKRIERERRAKEEKEKREHEEYLKLKATFDVEEEGFEEKDIECENNLLDAFIQYIKTTKVVFLEDLAARFKMKTQDAIDRVSALNKDGTLTGVMDDRGKFIFVSQQELESVAKFVKQRGRVSIAELAESSNQLISLA